MLKKSRELVIHLLIHYEVTGQLWSFCLGLVGVVWIFPSMLQLFSTLGVVLEWGREGLGLGIIGDYADCLWERNNNTFNGKEVLHN